MNFSYNLEVILVFINIFLWLGPIFNSLRKGIFNPLHPQFMTPIFITYFIINVMLQKWFLWMMLGLRVGMLKTTHENLAADPDYLILPLIFVALAAPFYHFGVSLTSNKISKSFNDRILINENGTVISPTQKNPFLLVGFFLCLVCWVPNYLLPNAGYGTFWTFPLALTSSFLPFMIFLVNKPIGILCFGSSIVAGFILRSKASFLFPLLPIFFYYATKIRFNSIFSLIKPKFIIIMITFFCLAFGLLFIGFGTDYTRLLHRDYAFEVFAAIVKESPITGVRDGPVWSWTIAEIKEGIPSILWPGKANSINPAKLVSFEFLPHDYYYNPGAYYNRFLLFAGYYDFGLIGALLSSMGYGMFYGWLWTRTKQKIIQSGYLWPLFLYITVPGIGVYYIASGGLTYGLINAFVPSAMILLTVIISRFIVLAIRRKT